MIINRSFEERLAIKTLLCKELGVPTRTELPLTRRSKL